MAEGEWYCCEDCGRDFFISYETNSCQCSGCLERVCPECEEAREK